MRRTKEDLLKELLDEEGAAGLAGADSGALIVSVQARAPVVAVLKAVRGLIPPGADPELAGYFQFALMGVSQGFVERNLSPFIQPHLDIIPLLFDDIAAVFEQLKSGEAEYDQEEFRFRSYDYGLHKAYYLDWTLYMSKEMY